MLTSPTKRKRLAIQPYEGPTCPRCDWALTADWIRSGIVRCPDCNSDFEATAFTPPVRRLKVVEVAATGPDGASACANHARNAATTSCTRCGLFICALCDMNVGTGSYCPACFDRVRSDGSLSAATTKTRDYFSMARIAVVVGIFFSFALIGPLFGGLALSYQAKGRKQRLLRGEDPWPASAIVVMILAILEISVGLILAAVLIGSMLKVF
jgi:ribosomal protein L37AE/L43A